MTYTIDSPAAQVAGILADASTTNPATGTYRHYTHDNLGSTRRLRASDKSSLGAYEYTPYGQAYATSGVALGDLGGAFTGKAWDDTSQLYYFPYRYYSPAAARWLTRDPLGMVDGPNVYAYVMGNPSSWRDADGRGLPAGGLLVIVLALLTLLIYALACKYEKGTAYNPPRGGNFSPTGNRSRDRAIWREIQRRMREYSNADHWPFPQLWDAAQTTCECIGEKLKDGLLWLIDQLPIPEK